MRSGNKAAASNAFYFSDDEEDTRRVVRSAKAKTVIAKEENGVTPRFYVRILVEMEDLINETWEDREGRKNMNKTNGKCLSSLRQKIRKYIREHFDDDCAKFRENPDDPDDDDDEKLEEADDSEERSSRGPP